MKNDKVNVIYYTNDDYKLLPFVPKKKKKQVCMYQYPTMYIVFLNLIDCGLPNDTMALLAEGLEPSGPYTVDFDINQ